MLGVGRSSSLRKNVTEERDDSFCFGCTSLSKGFWNYGQLAVFFPTCSCTLLLYVSFLPVVECSLLCIHIRRSCLNTASNQINSNQSKYEWSSES